MPLFDFESNPHLAQCLWCDSNGGDNRNAIFAMIAGTLFFTGWWFIIDAVAVAASFPFSYHLMGIIGTISLFMINAVSNAQMRGDSYSGGCFGPQGARVWLFVGFVMGFAAVIASCWILYSGFLSIKGAAVWPGFELVFQNVFIFAASLVYKFGRQEDQWS
ncbi:transmembrane protein 50A-like isoform X1 [Diaphorina citri]|uniref:Transmembrane protein 50A-like n=1 Tax=Diaphorina citri TaxID=121845 RepID=A0A1S3DBE6_DIACI|nr:transmembrane protein 50A-like [Diaphorina citri]XP_008478515.1 transmembrane protein 50A-like [Diaphorina citri]XP_008481239.1 transmembrane protein 50A-like isoform X1 [Diaphorina citri]XP_008481240.1 transmembrane protein 50A-like isoform X2 [Diaphorina citri]XP_026685687.1 transmembrane protein 50A-like isoform X1 [Diaphorina citri]KAI5695336.1 hypothetical protein M8J75_014767 [Diaphorina citri]